MANESGSDSNIGEIMVRHFWKLFAVTVFGLLVWGVYENRDKLNSFNIAASGFVQPIQHKSQSDMFYTFSSASNKQLQPAHILLKDGSGVQGYFNSADDDFLMLRSVYADKSETVTTLIPWENVQYIRMTSNMEYSK